MRGRTRFVFALAVAGALAVPAASVTAQRGASHRARGSSSASSSQQLVGTWRLLSEEVVNEKGAVVALPYGKHPSGKVTWTADGNFWAFLGPSVPRGAARPGSTWYTATYTIDAKRHMVVHQVQYSVAPEVEGMRLVRHYSFTGPGRLTVSSLPTGSKGQTVRVVLRFQKVAR